MNFTPFREYINKGIPLNGVNLDIVSIFHRLDSQFKTIDVLYTPTWTRVCSYFVGVLTGWILNEFKSNKNLIIGKKYVIAFWIIGPFINLFLIFGQVNKHYNPIVSVIFPAFAKIFWAIGIAWVIIACTTGNGGKFDELYFIITYYLRLLWVTYPYRLDNQHLCLRLTQKTKSVGMMTYFSIL